MLDSHAYARNDERAGTPTPDLIFRLSLREATPLRRVGRGDSRITLLLNQPNLGLKFQ